MNVLSQRITMLIEALKEADYILVGGGAGLSDAAGISYSGQRFHKNFCEYIEKYGLCDMYSAMFYPFPSQEEKWGYFAKHILVDRFLEPATMLYQDIYKVIENKKHFVITTNVDSHFEKAGFDNANIFETQGNYAYLQCAKGCHDTLYKNEKIVMEMVTRIKKCKVPRSSIPKCPVCGAKMDVNLRKDSFFIEDRNWHLAANKYIDFIEKTKDKKLILLEFGVGFSTPEIIRYPFESIISNNKNALLFRFNKDYPYGPQILEKQITSFSEDISYIITNVKKINNA